MRRIKGREIKEVCGGRRAVPHIQSQRGHGAAMFDGGAWSKPAGSGRAGTRGQEALERLFPECWDTEHPGTNLCSAGRARGKRKRGFG